MSILSMYLLRVSYSILAQGSSVPVPMVCVYGFHYYAGIPLVGLPVSWRPRPSPLKVILRSVPTCYARETLPFGRPLAGAISKRYTLFPVVHQKLLTRLPVPSLTDFVCLLAVTLFFTASTSTSTLPHVRDFYTAESSPHPDRIKRPRAMFWKASFPPSIRKLKLTIMTHKI